ncbi:MAG TPA: DUF5908 family protein [Chitinophagaceae bacterium]
MPIQINEVIIKAVIDNTSAPAPPIATANDEVSQNNTEIAEMILEILHEKNER